MLLLLAVVGFFCYPVVGFFCYRCMGSCAHMEEAQSEPGDCRTLQLLLSNLIKGFFFLFLQLDTAFCPGSDESPKPCIDICTCGICLWTQHLTRWEAPTEVLVELGLCWDKGGKEEKKSIGIISKAIIYMNTLTHGRSVPRIWIVLNTTGTVSSFNSVKWLWITCLDHAHHYKSIHTNNASKQSRRNLRIHIHSTVCWKFEN